MIDCYSTTRIRRVNTFAWTFPLFPQKSYSTLCPASVSIAASCRRVFSMHQLLPLSSPPVSPWDSRSISLAIHPLFLSFASLFSPFSKSTGVLFVVISYSGGVH